MKLRRFILILMTLGAISCQNKFYSIDDFGEVPKIDAHYHIYSDRENSVEQAQKDNFRPVCINTYTGECAGVIQTHQRLKGLREKYPTTIVFTTTFCLDGLDEPGWAENVIEWIDRCVEDGAVAVKVWKNVGMSFRDKDGVLIMIDDSRFDPIFRHLTEKGIPLVGHLGEPKNCWLPLEEMTTKNDSSYFAAHPEYHMYRHPEYPSYEQQISARNRMLSKNPGLQFIGCHLASLEWSVDEIAHFLDRFPHAAVDMAARMGQLFYQTREDRDKVRNFFIAYQDRILYGTDIIDEGGEKEMFQNRIHQTWLRDWEYLVTDNEMSRQLIEGKFRGLKLPREVVDKIYFTNARRWYKWM